MDTERRDYIETVLKVIESLDASDVHIAKLYALTRAVRGQDARAQQLWSDLPKHLQRQINEPKPPERQHQA